MLNNLELYHPISSTCIDYMHSVLEGVVKNFFKYWFGSEFSQSSFSLRSYMQNIEERLVSIRPPEFIPNTPRSIFSWNIWRGHEYLSFIIYFALPVFVGIMQYEHLQNLTKLVIFLEIILAREILKKQLDEAQVLIESFVSELENLYRTPIMLSGVHELLHLTDCIRVFGHLNGINLFPFEELNRKTTGFIHGYDLIGEELIKIFSTAQSLCLFVSKFEGKF